MYYIIDFNVVAESAVYKALLNKKGGLMTALRKIMCDWQTKAHN